jgi:hypothetical protein
MPTTPFPGMDPYLEHPDFWPGVLGALEQSRKKIFTTLLQQPLIAVRMFFPGVAVVVSQILLHSFFRFHVWCSNWLKSVSGAGRCRYTVSK